VYTLDEVHTQVTLFSSFNRVPLPKARAVLNIAKIRNTNLLCVLPNQPLEVWQHMELLTYLVVFEFSKKYNSISAINTFVAN